MIGTYILPISLFLALSSMTVFNMADNDIWFHMKAGEIITETGRFLYRDIFTFTAAGREWLYHEWLFGVLAYNLYNQFGVSGIILGKISVLTFAFIVIYRCMRIRGVNPYLASFILFLAVLAARFRLTERPHIFKYLFVATFIYVLDLYRLKGKNRLWLLPIIQLIWVNIHGSFILGPVLIGIYLLSEIAKRERNSHIYVLIAILIVTSLSTIINPYGARLIPFSLGFGNKAVLSVIGEWRATRLIEFYGAFGLLFVVGIASFLLRYRQIEAVDLLIFGLFAYLSIEAIRFTALFSLATAPVIAMNLQHLSSAVTYTRIKQLLIGILSLAVAVYLYGYEIKRFPGLSFGIGQAPTIPVRAVDFLKQLPIQGNMYNFHAFGGYLTWRLYPERKVFVDGRPEIYDKYFQNAFIISPSLINWSEAVDFYKINYAIIGYVKGKVDRIGSWITKDPKWVLIYWDDIARIYARKVPQNQGIINLYGHQVIAQDAYFNYAYLKEAIRQGLSRRLETELKIDIESNPKNTRAMYWLGMLYYETGRKEEAIRVMNESITK